MDKLLSIIIPVYNVEAYLRECLESVCSQTYSKIEIVVIDDGSTDGSPAICDEYAKEDDRIVVIHQDNMGLVGARKKGLEIATGEYIGFVDSDDYISENFYYDLMDSVLKTDADMCYNNNIVAVSEHSRYLFERSNLTGTILVENIEKVLLEHVLVDNSNKILPAIYSKVYKASIIKAAYSKVPNENQLGEDLICLCNVIPRCKKMTFTSASPYFYRIRTGSLAHSTGIVERYEKLANALEVTIMELSKESDVLDALQEYEKMLLAKGINSLCDKRMKLPLYKVNQAERLRDKKIVLYGAGVVGKDIFNYLFSNGIGEIVAWMDKSPEDSDIAYYNIESIENVMEKRFDYIILCSIHRGIIESMREVLMKLGVPKDKIIDEIVGLYL